MSSPQCESALQCCIGKCCLRPRTALTKAPAGLQMLLKEGATTWKKMMMSIASDSL